MTSKTAVTSILALAFLLNGCGEKPKTHTAPATQEPTAAVKAAPQANPKREARKLFDSTCSACHGKSGAGDGPGAAAMEPKPRNFADTEWQDGITDEELTKVILGGGAAVGKSPLMPSNPGLKNKPNVVLELIKKIRKFGK